MTLFSVSRGECLLIERKLRRKALLVGTGRQLVFLYTTETTTKTDRCTLIVYVRSRQLERSAKTLDNKHPS